MIKPVCAEGAVI